MKSAYGSCVIRGDAGVELWGSEPPSVERLRPSACVRCARPAWVDAKRLRIVAHGRRVRRVLRPNGEGGDNTKVTALRFRCAVDGCGAVMLVVPRDILPTRHYSASAIGIAAWLWGHGGLSPRAARERVSPLAADEAAPGWRQLRRWVELATDGHLFDLAQPLAGHCGAQERAGALASQLAGAAPPNAPVGPLEGIAALGSVAIADPHHRRARAANRPTKLVTPPARAPRRVSRTA